MLTVTELVAGQRCRIESVAASELDALLGEEQMTVFEVRKGEDVG